MFKTTLDIPEKSRNRGHYCLSWYESIDLDELYPISFAFVLQRSFPFLVSYLGIICALVLGQLGFLPEDLTYSLDAYRLPIIVLSTGLLAVVLAFWQIHRRSYDIRIEGMRLNFTKGVFKKSTGVLVLRSHNVIYLYQNPLDLLFGVFQLQVYGSNQPQAEYACLPALVPEDAFDLFRFLADEFSNQVSVPGAELEEET